MPTCVAAAGGSVDPAWKLDGVNLLPYLTGENPARPHQTLYWRIDGMWAIRHGDWKLVHGRAGNDRPRAVRPGGRRPRTARPGRRPAGQGPGAQGAVGRLERRTGPVATGQGQDRQASGQSRQEGSEEGSEEREQLGSRPQRRPDENARERGSSDSGSGGTRETHRSRLRRASGAFRTVRVPCRRGAWRWGLFSPPSDPEFLRTPADTSGSSAPRSATRGPIGRPRRSRAACSWSAQARSGCFIVRKARLRVE